MINRFKYLAYDSIASEKQNYLRVTFTLLHDSVEKGKIDEIQSVELAFDGYYDTAVEARARIIEEIRKGNTSKALNYLEILYFLMGKSIREDLIARLSAKKAIM